MKPIVLLWLCIPAWPQVVRTDYAKLPLSFEPNYGQTDERVQFLARAPGYMLFLTQEESVIAGRDGSVERMKLIGANLKARFEQTYLHSP